MTSIEIYNMTLTDLELIKENLLSDFDDFWNYTTLKNELSNPNSKYFVAKENNKIVGFAGIWKSIDDMHITNIVVKKQYRRKKIASYLIEKLIEFAKSQKEISEITLEVNTNNIPAIKLYEKYSFNKVGIRKKYYNNKNDALIMTKKI